jgi:chromate transport protein ChrA
MTISEILNHWGATPSLRKLLHGVSDSEVLSLAVQAAILLGKRAQQKNRKDVEAACRTFIAFMLRERADMTHKTYRMERKSND